MERDNRNNTILGNLSNRSAGKKLHSDQPMNNAKIL